MFNNVSDRSMKPEITMASGLNKPLNSSVTVSVSKAIFYPLTENSPVHLIFFFSANQCTSLAMSKTQPGIYLTFYFT